MNRLRTHILTTTVLAGISLSAAPAFAQAAQPTVPDQNQPTNPGAAPPSGPVEANPTPTLSANGAPVSSRDEIVITGSRIPQANLTSAAPVVTVSNQDIKLSGATRIDDVLNQLPSAAATQGPSLPNPATGTAEIDLRYLGSKRTLTLVNGRRLSPGKSQPGDHRRRRHQHHSSVAGKARRGSHRRSFVSLWRRRRRRSRQLHPRHRLHGAQVRRPIFFLPAQQQLPQDRHSARRREPDDLRRRNEPRIIRSHGKRRDGRAIDERFPSVQASTAAGDMSWPICGYRKQNAILQGNRDYSACNLRFSTTSQTQRLRRIILLGRRAISRSPT